MTTPSERAVEKAKEVYWPVRDSCAVGGIQAIAEALDAFAAEAVRAEREACALIAQAENDPNYDHKGFWSAAAYVIQQRIRARSAASGEAAGFVHPCPCNCHRGVLVQHTVPCCTPKAPRP